jgi:tRNA(Ile)-lysidine synthase TilS/MesJ
LAENIPGADLDASGVCVACRNFSSEGYAASLEKSRAELGSIVEQVKEQNVDRTSGERLAEYDCIVALSGGKDSCYTLKRMVEEFGLRCLAITIDNGFLSHQSIENSRLFCDTLGADFMLLKPNAKFMKSLYRESIDGKNPNKGAIVRASDLCNGCINLINSIMLKEAVSRNVSIIAGGYISGQVPKGSCVLRMRLETLSLFSGRKMQSVPRLSRMQYQVSKSDLDRFTNGKTVFIVNPMLSIHYDQARVLAELAQFGWKKSNDTGMHSSNCRINDLGIRVHKEKYGFHPYEVEIADQVRAGTLAREVGIEKLEAALDDERLEDVERVMREA